MARRRYTRRRTRQQVRRRRRTSFKSTRPRMRSRRPLRRRSRVARIGGYRLYKTYGRKAVNAPTRRKQKIIRFVSSAIDPNTVLINYQYPISGYNQDGTRIPAYYVDANRRLLEVAPATAPRAVDMTQWQHAVNYREFRVSQVKMLISCEPFSIAGRSDIDIPGTFYTGVEQISQLRSQVMRHMNKTLRLVIAPQAAVSRGRSLSLIDRSGPTPSVNKHLCHYYRIPVDRTTTVKYNKTTTKENVFTMGTDQLQTYETTYPAACPWLDCRDPASANWRPIVPDMGLCWEHVREFDVVLDSEGTLGLATFAFRINWEFVFQFRGLIS